MHQLSQIQANRPLVSVIMIFLNEERFISEAIESVLAQSYRNWELLLVDDGSTDRSAEIAREYATRCPDRIRYLSHPDGDNRGMSAARNLGLGHARGDFVAFLDADDVWYAYTLARQVAAMEAHPEAGLIHGATEYWFSWTGAPDDLYADYVDFYAGADGIDHLYPPPELLIRFLSDSMSLPGMGSVVVRRELLEDIGGFDERFRGLYEDQVFLSKAALAAPAYVSHELWARYRQHGGSACRNADTRRERQMREAYLRWLIAYLRKHKIEDERLWQLLRERWSDLQHPHRARLKLLRKPGRAKHAARRRLETVAGAVLPERVAGSLRRAAAGSFLSVPPGTVRFGDLRRLAPLDPGFGYNRGGPVDRYYIERFLEWHADDIRGRVLEIGERTYTCRYGGERVQVSDVLHVHEGNPEATIVGDLATADHIPSDTFDCVIITQTLHLIYDFHAALATIHRILKPGGVMLATVPGTSQSSRDEWAGIWYWSFTKHSMRRLIADAFPNGVAQVESYGNVLAAAAFLYGVAAWELTQEERDFRDPQYEVVVTVRARKAPVAP
ncbi:MAG TPA: glycosyltransferase [Thermomicrobiales bacterium]|nr:glycosyltransferase [Thermomicrobiales bacterium]